MTGSGKTIAPLKFDAILELTKFKVSIAVSLSAFAGYVLFAREINFDLLVFSVGLLLIIGASSALNHIQERNFDGLMERTSHRPLPSKILSLKEAVFITAVLFFVGSLMLILQFSLLIWFGSLFAAFWYNGIYTPLKRKTPYAIIPGSMVGAIPPFIGYWAAGGPLFDLQIFMLSAFFFIGQIPHFWLLMKKYHKDYQKAGYPVINEQLDHNQINRMIIIWMAAGIGSALVVSLVIPFSKVASYVILLYCVFFLVIVGKDLLKKVELKFGKNFLLLNMLYLLVMLTIIVDFMWK